MAASSSRGRSSSPFHYRKPSSPFSSSSSSSSFMNGKLMPRSCSSSATPFYGSGNGYNTRSMTPNRMICENPVLSNLDSEQIKAWFQNHRCLEKQRKEALMFQSVNDKMAATKKLLLVANDFLQKELLQLVKENEYIRKLLQNLELQYAAETNALEPRHTYVPWLVVDGQPLYDDYTDFISYICKAYKGTTLPKACSESSLRTSTEEKANGNNPVCYAKIKTTLSRLRSAITSWIRQDYTK